MFRIRFLRTGKAVVVFLVSFCICIMVTVLYINNKNQLEYSQMGLLVSTQSNKVTKVIEKLLFKTQTLAALVIQNDGNILEFERIASTIIDDPAIRNVILAPNGVVSQVYPMEGNESAIGLDYFSEGNGNKEAVMAKETGQLVLGGPFELIQGGQALVGRYPVYRNNIKSEENFWGIVSVTLDYPEALDGADLDQLRLQGFAYEIWRISKDSNKRQIISNSNYTYEKDAPYVEQKLSILNADWYFRLSPIKLWYQYPETWIFTLGGLAISLTIALLVLHNYDLHKMSKELTEISYQDGLTGALNRRGLFRELEHYIGKNKNPFVLCYIDLDKFKGVNDNYGHNIGDMILQKFVEKTRNNIHTKDLVARIGGDEFLIILTNIKDKKYSKHVVESIQEDLNKDPLCVSGDHICIAFSAGLAFYPEDGATVDQLLKSADDKMYQLKHGRG